ncbi:hypothetical protein AA18890_2321 [Komagataeibacter europaeus LMG 18890]|nr:hypothetical protein AA18890_2321 [Komagataeibacter europaeus LMG 18890]
MALVHARHATGCGAEYGVVVGHMSANRTDGAVFQAATGFGMGGGSTCDGRDSTQKSDFTH